jgi:hypothetical protein
MNLSLVFSLLKNRLVQLLLAAVVAGLSGLWYGYSNRPEPEKHVVEKTIVDQKSIDEAVDRARQEWSKQQKTRTVTKITTKPDGEQTSETLTETETNEKNESENVKTVTKTDENKTQTDTDTSVKPRSPEWSATASVYKSMDGVLEDKLTDKTDFDVRMGRRVFKDLWVEGSYRFGSKDVGVGIRFQF